ncbi:MAG: tetraacyldisaccharide 4'-kinase [Pseudomonadota bacterium]
MRHWARRGALARLLWPVSLLFGVLIFSRRVFFKLRIFKSHSVGIPVIIVGNLSVGGAGKTPLVLWVADFLKRGGWKPGIVSRGHGGSVARGKEARAATIASDPAEVGDEPILLSRRSGCPVWVSADRVLAATTLHRESPEVDVIIADDGLQHYALRRDLEICVLDARSLGNGWLLPAGPLREPLSRLRSVDAVVHHGSTPSGGFHMALQGENLVNLTNARDVRPAKSFAGQKVHAVAGIGDPKRFFLQLAGFGLKVVPHPFPDHHPFRAGDLDFGDQSPVVMTEKDAVKCKAIAKAHHWVFAVDAAPDPALGRWLLEKLGGRKAA